MLTCPSCGRSHPRGTERCPHDGQRLELPAETLTDPFLGSVFDGRYELLERVGTGGMGAVYRAVQTNVGRDVAVKVLSLAGLENADALRRFENEARVISQLHHPNTLKLIDFGRTADGRPYLVTEFLRGQPLQRLLDAAPKSTRWTLGVLRQVCDALAEAHALGIVHRDLKPENIFVEVINGAEIVRVLDFGIAKLGQNSHTITGTVFGTPVYMSPEQAQGDIVDARSDLYSMGVIAYRCLVGRPPFSGEQALAILLKHLQEAPVPPRLAAPNADIPLRVEELVLALLAKSPVERPQTALELRDRIDRLLGAPEPLPLSEPSHASEPLTATLSGPGEIVAPSRLGLFGGLFLLVALSILGAVWWKSRDKLTELQVEALSVPTLEVPKPPPGPPPVVEVAPREAVTPIVPEVRAGPPSKPARPIKKASAPSPEVPAVPPEAPKKKVRPRELPPGFIDY